MGADSDAIAPAFSSAQDVIWMILVQLPVARVVGNVLANGILGAPVADDAIMEAALPKGHWVVAAQVIDLLGRFVLVVGDDLAQRRPIP
jgi:hypothetical protein